MILQIDYPNKRFHLMFHRDLPKSGTYLKKIFYDKIIHPVMLMAMGARENSIIRRGWE